MIAVNDGSKDNTAAVLDALALEHPRLRVLHLAQNQGKAVALRMGAVAARSEYLVCIDGDALLDKNAAAYMVAPMLDNPRLGAVTGNPRIRTRSPGSAGQGGSSLDIADQSTQRVLAGSLRCGVG